MTDYFKLSIPRDGLLSLSTLGLAHLGDGVYAPGYGGICLRPRPGGAV